MSAGALLPLRIVAAAILSGTLSACAPVSFEPARDRETGDAPATAAPASADTPTHEVAVGETLYSIAWESGIDYRTMATWNGIAPPYLIKPGQKLRLTAPEKTAAADGPTVPATHRVRRGETLYRVAMNYDIEVDDLARWNHIGSPYRIVPGQTLRLAEPPENANAATKSANTRAGTRKARTSRNSGRTKPSSATGRVVIPAGAARSVNWAWPAEGTVSGRFGAGGSRGIDIAGRKGQVVRAAGDGQVVYQGGGLRGYGQLIILKHNAEFLSAYAHCDRIHVKEGEVIKRGQRIADMGNSGTDRVKLHFEIRYRGTPVDPSRYLPTK